MKEYIWLNHLAENLKTIRLIAQMMTIIIVIYTMTTTTTTTTTKKKSTVNNNDNHCVVIFYFSLSLSSFLWFDLFIVYVCVLLFLGPGPRDQGFFPHLYVSSFFSHYNNNNNKPLSDSCQYMYVHYYHYYVNVNCVFNKHVFFIFHFQSFSFFWGGRFGYEFLVFFLLLYIGDPTGSFHGKKMVRKSIIILIIIIIIIDRSNF